jgi:5'-3' exonuclease
MPNVKDNEDFSPPQLIFFDVWLLRLALEQYLKLPEAIETKTENGKKDFDLKNIFNLERAIDDFILLVSLMGNDFVPGLPIPEWEINEGAINKVVDAWKKSTLNQKGYIVKNGELRLDRLRNLFKQLAALEGFPAEAQGESCIAV